MKILPSFKLVGVAFLALGMAVGCASGPKPSEQGPSQADAAKAAIAEAKAANAQAHALGHEWRDTGVLLKKAEEAAKKGDNQQAIKLANEARDQAQLAIQQAQREEAMQRDLRGAPKTSAANSYTVARGDSLWKISGKSDVYGNPYEWPLLYKANTDKIKDPDLIYPGQNLAVDTGASQAAVDAAVRHAKTRGAWKIGTVEQSDERYLARVR